MAEDTDHVVAEWRASGKQIGPLLYDHGYFEAWAVGDTAILKIPRKATEYKELSEGEGPLVARDNKLDYMESAGAFLDAVIARERTATTPVLARFVDRIEIAGVGCALYERAGDNFYHREHALVPIVPAVARALLELHASFGFHGDVHAKHIFVDGDRVTFTDPLPHPSGLIVGTVGFSLPLLAIDPTDARDEGMLLRDLGALTATIVPTYASLGLRWDRYLNRLATAIFKGGFGNGFWTTDELAASRSQISLIMDPALRGWANDVVELVFNSYTVGYPPRGTTTRYLEALANTPPADKFTRLREAILPMVPRLHAPPSLMAFIVAERARTGANESVIQAFNACNEALARLPPLVANLRGWVHASFGAAPQINEPPAVTHPEAVYRESYEMRTLLLDLELLFDHTWYTPVTLGEVGGRIARALALIEKLATNNQIQIAARRYINYVEQIK